MPQEHASATSDPVWNLRKSAEYLSVSPRTLQSAASARLIAFVQVSTRRIAFRVSELNRYIESRTQRAAR